jgi:AICAR transformylase/IMP cyclohydrolase PurH
VFCANTYNWSPDWAISNFIKSDTLISSKNVVAITLGAGTTSRSQRLLESYIKSKNGKLIASKSFYLWRPNDEALAQESNVALAINLTKQWADEIAKRIEMTGQ